MSIPIVYCIKSVEKQYSTSVGKRSALRYALFLMNEEETKVRDLSEALMHLKTHLHRCRYCHNVSDTEVCPICSTRIIKHARGPVYFASDKINRSKHHTICS